MLQGELIVLFEKLSLLFYTASNFYVSPHPNSSSCCCFRLLVVHFLFVVHCLFVIIVMIDCCVLALTCHLFNSTFFISYSPPTSQFITSTSSQSPSHQRQLSSLSDSSPSFVVTSCSSSSSSSPVVLVLLNSISQIHVALMNDITVLPHDDRSPS